MIEAGIESEIGRSAAQILESEIEEIAASSTASTHAGGSACWQCARCRVRRSRDTVLAGTVEQHPYGKIVRDFFKAVWDMGSAEQNVPGTDCGHRVLDPITAGPRCNEIEF